MLLFLFLWSYYLFERDLMEPAVVGTGITVFCGLFGYLEYENWQFYDYSMESVFFLLFGMLFFIIGCGFSKIISTLKLKNKAGSKVEKCDYSLSLILSRYDIHIFYLILALIISLCTPWLYYNYIADIVGSRGFNLISIGYVINKYRTLSLTTVGNTVERIPLFLNILIRVSYAVTIVAAYSVLRNVIYSKFKKKDFINIFIIIGYVFLACIQSSRGSILQMIIFMLSISYFLLNIKWNWNKQIVAKKFINVAVKSFIAFMMLFLLLNVALERYSSYDKFDYVRYISTYISGGIRNFDLFIKQPLDDNKFIGQETFSGVAQNMRGLLELPSFNRHLEFRSIEFMSTGNLYTAFRRYYHDFGLLGLVVFPFTQGYLLTKFYNKVKNSAKQGKISFLTILYSCVAYTCFYIPIDDLFFSSLLSVRFVLSNIFLYFLMYVMKKFKFSL